MAKEIQVKQVEGQEVATEVLAASIRELAEGMRRLRSGKLNKRALLVLLKDACGVSMGDISKVLDGVEGLAEAFLKK